MTSRYDQVRHEFLLDNAEYFKDKKNIYLNIKSEFARKLNHPVSAIRICGSAYWGRRFKDASPFAPKVSDLDVAIVSPFLFAQCMSQIRDITAGFADLTRFPVRTDTDSYTMFQQYALKKGLLRSDFVPDVPIMLMLAAVCRSISRDYLDHFHDISACIYDTDDAFALKQLGAMEKLRRV